MIELLNQIKRLRVLVIGDVMLDRYVIGGVNRISPEAPVPILTVEEEKIVAGGAANVALNASSLGAKVEVCGWFGNDIEGEQLRSLLEAKGVNVDDSFIFSSAPTISKTRVTSSNQQICRVDREKEADSYMPDLSVLAEKLISKANFSDLVIISDYGKGFVSDDLLRIIRGNANFVSIDPKPSRLLNYNKPDLLTPNRMEALELAGKSRLTKQDFSKNEVVQKIFKKFSPHKLAITLGADGMLLAERAEIKKIIPTAAREVFDVSGAGDTVIAVLSMALVANGTFEQSAELANLAASIVVGKVGTASVTSKEILSIL